MITATVSGSFHRHMEAITRAVHELAFLGVRVLSPADPTVVAAQGEFLFVASDPVRSVRLVQDRHLESIRAASFLWLVCPDGYVGQSASMEIGYAAAFGVPIYSNCTPQDLTLRQYVHFVGSLAEAVEVATAASRRRPAEGVLINPRPTIQEAHDILEQIEKSLLTPQGVDGAAGAVHKSIARLHGTIRLPTYFQ